MKAVDLFAGCGGMSLGFQECGFGIIAAFEHWDAAIECYRDNFAHPIFNIDLSDTQTAIREVSKFKPDIIIGGPPCQDFSHAGKRIEGGRAGLTENFAQIVAAVNPHCFVMENVDRAMKSNAYGNARDIFKISGYGLTEIVLDASLCGVPQKRKRLICCGVKGERDGFALSYFLNRQSCKPLTLRDYFGESLGFEFYYRHPRNYSRRAIFSVDEPAPTMRGVNRPIPKGYAGHPGDAHIVDSSVRPLTTKERALIQTFPPSFKLVGNKTDVEQMIGNAVPVGLARYVAESIKMYFARTVAEE